MNKSFFKNHINEALRIAGPRYSADLSIENETHTSLISFNKDDNCLDNIKLIVDKLDKYPSRLRDCINECGYTKDFVFDTKYKNDMNAIIKELSDTLNILRSFLVGGYSKDKIEIFNNIYKYFDRFINKLSLILKMRKQI